MQSCAGWRVARAVLDPLEVTALAAKTAQAAHEKLCWALWSVGRAGSLRSDSFGGENSHEKLCGALWSVGRAVLDPLEMTASAAKTACTCPWSVTAVSKLWPKVASCPCKAVRGPLKGCEGSPGSLRSDSFGGQNCASCPWKAVLGPLKRWEGSPGSLRSDSFGGENCLYLPVECHSCVQALT